MKAADHIEDPKMVEAIEAVAEHVLDMETLEIRGNDDKDFNEHSVWNIRLALKLAYEAGHREATDTARQMVDEFTEAMNQEIANILPEQAE